MNIKNIIFDLGGVLVDWNPRYLYKKIFETEKEIDWFLTNICNSQWNSLQDAGRTLEEATRFLVVRHPEYTAEINAYYERWTEMLNGHIEGTVQILEKLKTQDSHQLLALTNWSSETFPTALEMFDFLYSFKGIVVSGDEKLIKPDHRIYQLLFNRYGIAPQESVFIDDSPANIEAAQDLGMRGILFTGPDDLEKQLNAINVLG
jgi:2-haloacid dehalogenase